MGSEDTTNKWLWRYYMLAKHVASWSKDPTTKVGSVLVGKDPRNMVPGYNGFPPGIKDLPERYSDRPTKYLYTQHAERNALDNARFSCEDATLVTTMFPCVECAKSIISKGVKFVVTPTPPEPLPDERTWRDDCKYSVGMFEEAGIRVFWVDEEKLTIT